MLPLTFQAGAQLRIRDAGAKVCLIPGEPLLLPSEVVMTQRVYSDEDVQDAMSAVAANAGYVKPTAKQLGVPRETLQNWVAGETRAAAVVDARQAALASRTDHKTVSELADAFLRLSKAAAERALETISTASPYHAALIAGISLDKWALITGRPTSRSEVLSVRLVAPDALRALSSRVVETRALSSGAMKRSAPRTRRVPKGAGGGKTSSALKVAPPTKARRGASAPTTTEGSVISNPTESQILGRITQNGADS